MEYHELSDLQKHLLKPFSEIEAQQITRQILEGLGYMHQNGFVHLDIKPAVGSPPVPIIKIPRPF